MDTASRISLLLAGSQNKTVTGPRPPFYSAISAAPASFGVHSSVTTAFNGDLSKLLFPVEHRVTGSATLGQPTTGYIYTEEAAALYLYSYNESGWNNSTSTNTGRTGATPIRVKVYQAGQGDHFAFNASGFVTSTRASSTKFLANPAIGIINGDLTSGVDGAYLNPLEFVLADGGFDAAGIGAVLRLNRTNATGAKSAYWGGVSVQSEGSAAVDNVLRAVGKFAVGIDFAMSGLDLGANGCALSMKANQWIYGNNNALASGSLDADWRTTGFNGDKFGYDSGISGWNFLVAGGSKLQLTSSQVTANTAFKVVGNVGFYNTAPVAKPTITGSRSANAALASLLTQLATLGLCTDSTTA